jgi:hypothetical protein
MKATESPIGVGMTLPNGATVIDYDIEVIRTGGGVMQGTVLALDHASPDPYITWTFLEEDGIIITINGHYFDVIEEAVADYRNRRGLWS